jgi:hypothetical protein
VQFYALLDLEESSEQTSQTWAQLDAQGGALCLHISAERRSDRDAAAVSLQATVPIDSLDAVHRRFDDAGRNPGAIVDETFGRYFVVVDPDGYAVQVNEVPAELQRSYETAESRAVL